MTRQNSHAAGDVEETGAAAVFDLNDPYVGIPGMDAVQIGIGFGFRHSTIADQFNPSSFAPVIVRGARCRTDQQYAPIQPVDLDIDASGFLRAAPDEHGGEARGIAATQIGLYPYGGFNAHWALRCGGTAGSA